jgi:23S rRNA (adenine2503-C2)-methyltransferase
MTNITVSTVGKAEGWCACANRWPVPAGAAGHRHQHQRAQRPCALVDHADQPRHADAELRELIASIPHVGTHRKICFGYVLIPGVNDAEAHADELAEYLRPFTASGSPDGKHRGMLNLIPYNPRRDSPWPAPNEEDVERFLGWVRARGVFAKRRRTKGRDTMAACGQLGTAEIRRRRFVAVRLADAT